MEPQIQSVPDSSQFAIIQKKLFLDSKIRSGASWFFAIAAFSLINTIVYLFGGHLTFVIGLGVTQIVDGVTSAWAKDFGSGGSFIRLVGFALDVVFAGLFVAFGVLGRKRHRAAFIVGMIVYTFDGIILLLFQDYLGAGFHAFALFGIWGGLKSISDLGNMEKTGGVESIESIRQGTSSFQPQTAPQPTSSFLPQTAQPQTTLQQWRTRAIILGLIILVFVFLCAYAAFQTFQK